MEGLTHARTIVRMLQATDVPELVEARGWAARAAIRLGALAEAGEPAGVAHIDAAIEALRGRGGDFDAGIAELEKLRRAVMGGLEGGLELGPEP